MSQSGQPEGLKIHPIHLLSIAVKELYIRANKPPFGDVGLEDNNKFLLATGSSGYDEQNCEVTVGIKVEVGLDEKEDAPFSMRIELIGQFKVDESQFPKEHVNDWARRNAPYILMPYVREQAYALTTRCGFRPMLIPLTQVPSYSIKK